MTWDRAKKCCGNCRFWALSPYGQGCWDRNVEGDVPSGNSGYHTDGQHADCRARAPTLRTEEYRPGSNAAWPHTTADDLCGAFELRETKPPQYAVGDKISMTVPRDWQDILWDRIRLRRWDVPRTEKRWFLCTSTSPGSLWPLVDE